MTKRKSKTKQALGVLPDRYTAKADAIQPSLQTQIAQIQREAAVKQNQLDYYLNGSNYTVKPDELGNMHIYMGDNGEEVPAEFFPALRTHNRYIDMALTPAPEPPTISPLSNELVQEQRYSPKYQDVLRRQRQNVYEHNLTEEPMRKPIREFTQHSLDLANEAILKNPVVQVLGYAVSPSTYSNLLSSGIDSVTGQNTGKVLKPLGYGLDFATMFFPITMSGKLKGVVDNISKAREYISGLQKAGELKITATSLTEIQNALKALEINPTNANAIKSLKAQLNKNPELVASLQSAKLFDNMEEFNQVLQPFKVDFTNPHNLTYTTNLAPVYTPPLPYEYEKLMQRVLPENRGIVHNGRYWRVDRSGSPVELKDGDWFLDENNQMRRVISKDGKLSDLLDSDLAAQRRQQIAAETEAKIKEAEQRGRDAAKKEMEEATLEESITTEAPTEQPKEYAYLPLKNGETVQLEVNGNTAVDPVTGSTFELYPGTTRVKQMDYTPNPSFYQEYGREAYDIDTGNPAKWRPRSKADPRTWVQALYSKAGNPENPQRLVSNYGVWDFANKDKGRWMNNTRELSPKKLWGLGIGAGMLGTAWIQGKGLWGVSKNIGNGVANGATTVLFGNDNPFKTPKDSTKKDTLTISSYQEPVDTMNAWGVNDMDAKLDSAKQAREQQ